MVLQINVQGRGYGGLALRWRWIPMSRALVSRASLGEASGNDGTVFQSHLSPLLLCRSRQRWHTFKRYDNRLLD